MRSKVDLPERRFPYTPTWLAALISSVAPSKTVTAPAPSGKVLVMLRMRNRCFIATAGVAWTPAVGGASPRRTTPRILRDAIARGGCPVDLGPQLRVDGFACAVHVEGSPGVLGVAVGGDELGQSEALLLVVTQREQQARSVLGTGDRELGVQPKAHWLARQQGFHPLGQRIGGLRGGVINKHLALAVVFASFLARDHQFLALEL